MRFLLIEQDKDYAERLGAMIETCCPRGVEIDLTYRCDTAHTLIGTHNYDVCFLEYLLDAPCTGLDLLREHNHASSLTAFVLLTTHANKQAAFEALVLGAMDYLIKDRFTPFELAKCIAYSMYLKHREVKLQTDALRDSLTGLGNKGLFHAQLEQAAKRASRDDEILGLLVIDIDGFKTVNDQYGHTVGDLLLQQIAERIVMETRASDVIARIGGDEFAAILIKPKSVDHIYAVGKKLEQALTAMPYNLNGTIVKIGASVGSSILPDDGTDLNALFKLADTRMYKAKNTKKIGRDHARDYMDQVLR
ncbi:MAG: GGDEF domain-containing response regulator [Rhodospirillales bacterium]|nr:GGDEF domain-containing response regulator [Rhodospirillales bacterium]